MPPLELAICCKGRAGARVCVRERGAEMIFCKGCAGAREREGWWGGGFAVRAVREGVARWRNLTQSTLTLHLSIRTPLLALRGAMPLRTHS